MLEYCRRSLVFVGLEMRQSQQDCYWRPATRQISKLQMSVEGAYVWLEAGSRSSVNILYKRRHYAEAFHSRRNSLAGNEMNVNAWLYHLMKR